MRPYPHVVYQDQPNTLADFIRIDRLCESRPVYCEARRLGPYFLETIKRPPMVYLFASSMAARLRAAISPTTTHGRRMMVM